MSVTPSLALALIIILCFLSSLKTRLKFSALQFLHIELGLLFRLQYTALRVFLLQKEQILTTILSLSFGWVLFYWFCFFYQGTAAFWFNLLKSGESDARTRHAGCPVIVGSKWGEEFNLFCHENFNANKSDIKLINEKQCSFISLSSFSFQQVDSWGRTRISSTLWLISGWIDISFHLGRGHCLWPKGEGAEGF